MSNYLIHRKDKQFAPRDNKLGVSPTFFKAMKYTTLQSPFSNLTGLTIDACYVSVMESDLIADFQQLFVTICLIFHWPQAIDYDQTFLLTTPIYFFCECL